MGGPSRLPAAADPRLRVGVALAALLVAIAAPHPASALAIGLAGAGALLVEGARARWRAVAPALFLGVVTAALRAVITPGTTLATAVVAGHVVTLSRPGAAAGALLLARVIAAGLVALWLVATVRIRELAAALAWYRVPAAILELLLLAHRYQGGLGDSLETVRAAQRLRLGYAGVRRGLGSAGVLMGAVTCRALAQAGATAEAMELRGDRGLLGLELPARCPRADVHLAGAAAIALATSALLSGVPW